MDFKDIELDDEKKIRITFIADNQRKKESNYKAIKTTADHNIQEIYHQYLANFAHNYNKFNIVEAEKDLQNIIELFKKYDMPCIPEVTKYEIIPKCVEYYRRRPNIQIASKATHVLLFFSFLSEEYCEEITVSGAIHAFESFINEEESIFTEPEMMEVLSNMMLEDKLKSNFDDLKIQDVLEFLLKIDSVEYIVPAARFLRIYSMGGVDEAHSELYFQMILRLFEAGVPECNGYLLYTIIELIKIDQFSFEQFFKSPLAGIVAGLIGDHEYEVILIFGLCIFKCKEAVELAPFGPGVIESFMFEECERNEQWMHRVAARCIYLSGLVIQGAVTDVETLAIWARWVVDGMQVMTLDLKQHSAILLISILKVITAEGLRQFDLVEIFEAFDGFISILDKTNFVFAVQTFIDFMAKIESIEIDANSLAESSGIIDTIRDTIEAQSFDNPYFDSFEALMKNNGF